MYKKLICLLFMIILTGCTSNVKIIEPSGSDIEVTKQAEQPSDAEELSLCTYERCVKSKLPPVELTTDCSEFSGVSESDCEAIMSRIVSQCSTGLCIQLIAMLENNADLCYLELVENSNSCFLDVAEYNVDIEECLDYKGNILECIKWVAKKLDSWEDCRVLMSNEHRRQCAINTEGFSLDERSPELNEFLESTVTSSEKHEKVLWFCEINTNPNANNYEKHKECCDQYNKDENYNKFEACENKISQGISDDQETLSCTNKMIKEDIGEMQFHSEQEGENYCSVSYMYNSVKAKVSVTEHSSTEDAKDPIDFYVALWGLELDTIDSQKVYTGFGKDEVVYDGRTYNGYEDEEYYDWYSNNLQIIVSVEDLGTGNEADYMSVVEEYLEIFPSDVS